MGSLILSNSPAKLDLRRPGDNGAAWGLCGEARLDAPGQMSTSTRPQVRPPRENLETRTSSMVAVPQVCGCGCVSVRVTAHAGDRPLKSGGARGFLDVKGPLKRADGRSKPATPRSALCAFLHPDLVPNVCTCVRVHVTWEASPMPSELE